jgi:hypothetical protein
MEQVHERLRGPFADKISRVAGIGRDKMDAAIATPAVVAGNLYHIYVSAKRGGVRLQLADIIGDFEQPHSTEFRSPVCG